jgi:hypothetical protein
MFSSLGFFFFSFFFFFLFSFSFLEDQFGNFDFSRTSGMSKSKLKKAFCAELIRRKEQRGESVFFMDGFKQIAQEMGIYSKIENFYEFVNEINLLGQITRRAQGGYEIRL